MSASHRAAFVLARATLVDTVRRPGFVVGAIALGAFLALLPRLGSPAAGLRDNASLALELWISTISIVGPLVAGILGIQAAQSDHDAGMSQELLAAPQGPGTYALGRWFGAATAACVFCVASAAVGATGWFGATSPRLPAEIAAWYALLGGLPVSILLGACLGLFYGAVAARELGIVILALHLAGARFVTSWAADAGVLAHRAAGLIPDPSRLDAAAAFAFDRPTDGGAVGLAIVATGLQLTAMMITLPILLRGHLRRRTP